MNKTINALLLTDGYKTAHHKMYPIGTEYVGLNFTPRSFKYAPVPTTHLVSFGTTMVFKIITDYFNEGFFNRDKEEVIKEAKGFYDNYLNTDYDMSHFEDLHDLGFLPIKVRALPEGSKVKEGVPILTIVNTNPKFYWITNFLETIISNLLWRPCTSATVAYAYRKLMLEYANKTDKENIAAVDYQIHDFSMRGMDSIESAMYSGMGHATSHLGSDSLPVIHGIKKYYNEEKVILGSVPASEHSVMSAGGSLTELETFKHLMKQYPEGILSVVSDTWNLWKVMTEVLPKLKSEILNRNGKLVVRGDSGYPPDIICGINPSKVKNLSKYVPKDLDGLKECFEDMLFDALKDETPHGEMGNDTITRQYLVHGRLYEVTLSDISWNRHDKRFYYIDYSDDAKLSYKEVEMKPEHKGMVELLWDEFGGTINEQGYKVLNPHVGAIYGDSITYERAKEIVERLEAKGFASTNVVLGIGSYTYSFSSSRDSFGFAMKATNCVIDGKHKEIFKDPVTDDGVKKSLKGLLRVDKVNGEYVVKDQISEEEEKGGELDLIYLDGKFTYEPTFEEIRTRLRNS